MDSLLNKFIDDEIKKLSIKDKLTGHMVRKHKRGTMQALEESGKYEEAVIERVTDYIHGWLLQEFVDGALKEKITNEINSAVFLELARSGYDVILKK